MKCTPTLYKLLSSMIKLHCTHTISGCGSSLRSQFAGRCRADSSLKVSGAEPATSPPGISESDDHNTATTQQNQAQQRKVNSSLLQADNNVNYSKNIIL